MKRLLLFFGIVLPCSVSAASAFDTFWEQSADDAYGTAPSAVIVDYVIEQATEWGEKGITLQSSDIDAAMRGDTITLCNDKQDADGADLILADGAAEVANTCRALMFDIQQLVIAEQRAQQLSDDLLGLTTAHELATSDEQRPLVDIPLSIQGMKRLWQGTGSVRLPWDSAADEGLNELKDALGLLSDDELDQVVYRFHHGYFRDQREADPRFDSAGDRVRSALSLIATQLRIDPNTDVFADIVVPALGTRNVGLWARKDELGLLWVTPTEQPFMRLTLPEQYPVYHEHGDRLAYPFAYEGSQVPPTDIRSPLCSRTMGMHGYLCRPLPAGDADCFNPNPNDFSLVRCSDDTVTVPQNISQCLNAYPLYNDDGTPLYDPDNPGQLNPNLVRAETGSICQPESAIQYPTGVMQNLCYTDVCLRESMSGHSLIPGRNPVLAYESTDPYLACVRPDPQLGLFIETPTASPTPIPQYLGIDLVKDFTASICQVTGSSPHPLSGQCLYDQLLRSAAPQTSQLSQLVRTATEGTDIQLAQERMRSLAVGLGFRSATDQLITVHVTALQPLISFLDTFGSLFRELLQAPPPTAQCPWTGPPTMSPTS